MLANDTRQLLTRVRELETALADAEQTLSAIRNGEVDAFVASGPEGEVVYTLKGADEGYRLLVQQMAEGAVTLARNGLILFANEQFASMLQLPLDRVIGSLLEKFVDAKDHSALHAILSSRDGGKTEVTFKTDGGASVPAYLSSRSMRHEGLDCVSLVVTDLSEQKRQEKVIAAGELARSILDQAAVAILVVDPDGRINLSSRVSDQLAGKPVLFQNFSSVFALRLAADADDFTFSDMLSILRSDGHITGLQAIAKTARGEFRHVIVNAAPLSSAGSQLLGVIVILSDITELKRTEAALRESESRLRTLGDNLPQGAIYRYCLPPVGEPYLEFVSAGIERLTGVPARDMMQRAAAVDRLIVPEDFERLKAAVAGSRDRLTRLEIEIRHTHRLTGEMRWSLLRSMPFRRPDGTVVWDGVQLDITDRKRAEDELRVKEEQLRQAQKMESIGVLAGGIAHDFNNLLTGILGNASLIADSMPDWDPNRPAIKRLTDAANRAADLTRQMLAYSGKGQFFIRPVNLSESVRDLLDLLRATVPSNVEIHLQLQEDIASVQADPGQLQQIIMNLVLNASEAIGEAPGHISIRTFTRSVDESTIAQAALDIVPGTYVGLEVRDTGCGIEDSVRPRIFEPFFTTKFQGRGLGLAAVHGIVRAHHGGIAVYSNPGRGSLFTLLLPAVLESAARQDREAKPRIEPSSAHATILVVDDEATVRSVAQATLERFGYRVLLAANGIEAVKIFSESPHQIALVLLDLTMPLMSGEETLLQMRAIRPDVPVLLSSGYNQVEVLKRFAGRGLAGFVGKPYSAATLIEKVRSVIS